MQPCCSGPSRSRAGAAATAMPLQLRQLLDFRAPRLAFVFWGVPGDTDAPEGDPSPKDRTCIFQIPCCFPGPAYCCPCLLMFLLVFLFPACFTARFLMPCLFSERVSVLACVGHWNRGRSMRALRQRRCETQLSQFLCILLCVA